MAPKCFYCGINWNSSKEQASIKVHIKDCWPKCKRCQERFSWDKAHEEHEAECEEAWTCDYCWDKFDTEDERDSHENGC
jgi:hypothetical protein